LNVERSGRMVSIRVTDTGTEISAEEMQKIFEFAFRGAGQTRFGQVGSLGLGLALVRRVAEVHYGKVAARNLDPQGAESSSLFHWWRGPNQALRALRIVGDSAAWLMCRIKLRK
jgi:signal transduction histidine kinase